MGRRETTLAGVVEALLGEPAGSAPDHEPALGEWLASLGLIRVPVADPSGFQMPGRFLARFPEGWTVMFGVPPGAVFDPAGVAAGGGDPVLLAAHQVSRVHRPARGPGQRIRARRRGTSPAP